MKKKGKNWEKRRTSERVQTGSRSQQPTVTEVTPQKSDRWMERMGLRTKETKESRRE